MVRKGVTAKIVDLVYANGCVTIQKIYEALGREHRISTLSTICKLVKRGVIVSPWRGIYCRPDIRRVAEAAEVTAVAEKEVGRDGVRYKG